MQTKGPGSGLLAYVDRYFFWVIVASYFAAMEFPELGLWIRQVDLG